MMEKTFLPLEAEKIINNLDYEILDYLPEIFISLIFGKSRLFKFLLLNVPIIKNKKK